MCVCVSDIDSIPDKSEGSFDIEFSPLPADFDLSHTPLPRNPHFSTLHYNLSLSTMHVSSTASLNNNNNNKQ